MIHIPPSARSAALEATEEARRHAVEAAGEFRKSVRSLYSQVSCSDLSSIQAPDCRPLKGGSGWGSGAGGSGGGRDVEGAVTLDWRADPIESMSDLILTVYDGSPGGGISYHVHTLLLAYGGRKSGFVLEQIKGQGGSGSGSGGGANGGKKGSLRRQGSSSSGGFGRQGSSNSNVLAEHKVDVYVPPLAARHVPRFLDYVYGASPELSTDTAPSLRYLANRFDCRDLHREVTHRFVPRDLELGTAPKYCEMADELKDFELRDRSLRIMAERFERMNVGLLRRTSPRIVRSLVQCDKLSCGSEVLSEKVAEWLRLRDADAAEDDEKEVVRVISPLTDEDFYWLTHCQHMPTISPAEGLFYLSYGTRFPQVMNEVGSGSLASRCLAACAEDVATDRLASHLERPEADPLPLYENLEVKAKVRLLESTLLGARRSAASGGGGTEGRDAEKEDVRRTEELHARALDDAIAGQSTTESEDDVARAVVLGCGVAPANGLYLLRRRRTDRRSAPGGGRFDVAGGGGVAYEREAVWDGRRATFVVRPVDAGRYYVQYELVVRRPDGRTSTLYNSPAIAGSSDADGGAVPERGWEVVEEDDAAEGLDPPPRFVGRVERTAPSGRGTRRGKSLTRSVP
ncbi:hypothetical protein ACHAWF_015975 [Thalassiosira exigua]